MEKLNLACIMSVVFMVELSIRLRRKMVDIHLKKKMTQIMIYSCGSVLWPILWAHVLGPLKDSHYSLPGLVWPILILLGHMYLLRYTNQEKTIWKVMPIHADASTICSLTFTLSSILSAQNKGCSHVFTAAIFACLFFIVPMPSIPTMTMEHVAIEALQQVCLSYSIGFLLSGVLLVSDCNKMKA